MIDRPKQLTCAVVAPERSNDPGGVTYIHRLVGRLETAGSDRAIFSHSDRNIGAAEFLSSIYRFAHSLRAIGVNRSSVVALLAPNCPEAIAVRYAANMLGAATCYLSAPPTEDARSKLIETIKPTVLVVFPKTSHLLPRGVQALTVSVGECGLSFGRLDEIEASYAPIDCQARPDSLGVIVSSGGSTGVPKGSCRDFASYTAMVDTGHRADRRQLVNGRLAYLSQVLVDQTLLGGGTVVLRDGFDAADTLAQVEKQRITDIFLVEPQLFELMDHPEVATSDLSSLRTIIHVGTSAPPVLRQRARARLGAVVAHTYGASEEGLISLLPPTITTASSTYFACAGRILSGVEIRFRRPDGLIVGPGELGSIETKSPATAQSYRNRPDLTAQKFKEGWCVSGDLGYLDDDGYLHILGRTGDVEAVDGKLVTPTMIENTLCSLASVRYAVVIVDQERARKVAAVVPWRGQSVATAACTAAIFATHGSEVARSLNFVVLDSVPLTEQGKPDRSVISQL